MELDIDVTRHGDYLRGCGGTSASITTLISCRGLSPRVRRNLRRIRRPERRRGTISAGAEEPLQHSSSLPLLRDYLRGCGGTHADPDYTFPPDGLSPRVRRNRSRRDYTAGAGGTISAGAEEPPARSHRRGPMWDYLRGCGGTKAQSIMPMLEAGLSPRVRRNQYRGHMLRILPGTISAGAEEPPNLERSPVVIRDYLRGCGGTHFSDTTPPAGRGLSPRVRRNLDVESAQHLRDRTISAGAEEPKFFSVGMRSAEDYLRGCGGTEPDSHSVGGPSGLSPRVRRNPRLLSLHNTQCGTISAGAEEPAVAACNRRHARDYLRGCGGTTSFDRSC